jgi:hypothetical protein
MNQNILNECIDNTLEELEQEHRDMHNSVISTIERLEREIDVFQTARYNPDDYGYSFTDEQFDIIIANHQHQLERNRLTNLAFNSKSNAFSRRICERLMRNAVSHRELIEEMMELSLINENVYNDESKKLMNHYNRVKERFDEMEL